MERTYYWLSPDVAIIRLDDGSVLFKSDTLAIKIETESINLLLEKIFPLLDGKADIDEIATKLNTPRSSLEPHLHTLFEKGILKCSNTPFRENSGFEKFLSNISISPELVEAVANSLTIAIFGLEGEGVLIARSLLSSGIKNLIIVDPFVPGTENKLLMDEYKNSEPHLTRQEIIKHLLQINYPSARIETPFNELNKELVAEVVRRCDFSVCCFDKTFLSANYWINAAAMDQKKPVIFSAIDAHKCIVGPMIIPGQTACFMCYKMRTLSNADDFEIAMATEKHLNKGTQPQMSSKAFLHSAINYNSSILTTEILKYVFEIGPPALASRVTEFNLLDLATTTHHVLEVPECRICKKKMDRHHSNIHDLKHESNYKSDISQYQQLLKSDKTGIINHFGHYQKDISEPVKPYIFRADLSNHRFLKKKDVGDNTCSGKGFIEEKAKVSALGEAVERYSGACYNKNEIILSSYDQLDANKLNPEQLVLFSQHQYEKLPYKPYSHNSIMGWVNAYSLKDDRPIYVPAVSVFMNYEMQTEDEYIFQITSNGLAAGSTLLGAILSAALEVIERDAFIVAWHNKFPCKKIDPLSIPGDNELSEFINAYKRRGVQLYLFELPTDFPCHAFMALGIQENGDGPYAVTGLGADFDPIVAARSALMEVGQVRPALKKRLRQQDTLDKLQKLLADPSMVKELNDHDLLFATKDTSSVLNFLLKSEIETFSWYNSSLHDAEKLDLLIDHVRKINSDLIYYDLTPLDMKKLGLYTCRAIIPHMQPIHFGYENIRLGGTRLYEQSVHLGFSEKVRSLSEIDLYPHPLA